MVGMAKFVTLQHCRLGQAGDDEQQANAVSLFVSGCTDIIQGIERAT